MSVARMKRITLYGEAARKDLVLEWLQELGCMHVTSIGPRSDEQPDLPTYSKRNYEALRHLLDSRVKHPLLDEDTEVDLDEVVSKVLDNRQRLRDVTDSIDHLEHQLKELAPWGDFKAPPPEELRGLRLWFYVLPAHRLKEMKDVRLPWQVVNRMKGVAYLAVISEEMPPPDEMPAPPVELPPQSISEIHERLLEERANLEDIRAERHKLTKWIAVLTHRTVEADNRSALDGAASYAFDAAPVFALSGWVAAGDVDAVMEFSVFQGVACTVDDPEPGDSPPIMLSNRRAFAPGEELVGFFQLPGYNDWDPSAVVFVSFAIFFAMIFSDAGYGALFGVVVLLLSPRMRRTHQGRRFRAIGFAVTFGAIVYGVLVGSYFGTSPPDGSFLAALHVLDINDFDSMMRICVLIGAAHVIIANGGTARRRGFCPAALAPAGWIVIVLAGLGFYFKSLLPDPDTVSLVATIALVAGALGVVGFSSERPVRKATDVLIRLLEGLKGLSGVTTAFGDVLSYLRLFALGLSSASLALTFNQLAAQVIDAAPGIGILLAILIVVAGHALNAVLCVIGGLVHGLRLNLIEFYHWSIFDEGSPFRAFSKKEAISWTQ